MKLERCLKDKKKPEYVTMRKETVDLSIRSWLCSTQEGSSSAVNLRFVCEPLIDRVINLIFGGFLSIQFIHSFICPRNFVRNFYETN